VIKYTSQLSIASRQGDYSVIFAASERELLDALEPDDRALLLADASVVQLYPRLAAAFDPAHVFVMEALEENKTLEGVGRCCLFLQAAGASKRSRLVVVGGGIVQDVGAFCAHVFYRGIPYDYIPTTLLAMADSCIGSKCAVNLGSYKNQLGFFESPRKVLQWPGFLATLKADDVRSGFGEILKLAITGGRDSFAKFESHMQQFGFEVSATQPMIALALATKKPIIELDEHDEGIRKTLNYGHTFGHALETVTEHRVPHGLAVAWGVDLANFVAWQSGRWAEADFMRVHELIARSFSFDVPAAYGVEALLVAIGRDKKAAEGSVLTILPDFDWKLQFVPQELGRELSEQIETFFRCFDPFTHKNSP
jgi:3-dehydroquinate synthase